MFQKLYEKLDAWKWTYFNVDSQKCILSDRAFISKYYFKRMGKKLDLKYPKTLAEKLNWLKIYYHDPLMTICADKYRMREYVKLILGEGYTPALLGVWEKPEEIDFDKLPQKFVLKTNHDGCPIICTDKSKLDFNAVRQQLSQKLKTDYYARGREWAYKNIKRLIFAEEYLEPESGELIDYKFFCFNGEPKLLYVISEKINEKNGALDYFDIEFRELPFKRIGKNKAKDQPQKPEDFEKMIQIAKKLSSYGEGGIPFVRVDMYFCNGKIFVGELTFYPTNGMHEFEPAEWNQIIGDYLILPRKNGYKHQRGRDRAWIRRTLKN